jgi:REP element-mobilizing transposase RayT
MPRKARITFLNYPHLVIAEANSNSFLFYDDDDYFFYLSILRQLVRDRLLKLFAFSLLPQEIRLVLEPCRLRLSRIMQRLHGKYSVYLNKRYQRRGYLFLGRFKSIIFNANDILPAVRAVHLWPVRQGLLRRPELYPYASHGSYMGLNKVDFLACSDVLAAFSGDSEAKKRAFARYVEVGVFEPDNYGINEIKPSIALSLLERVYSKECYKPSLKNLAAKTSLLLSISEQYLMSLSRRQDLVMARRLLATAAVLRYERSITEVAQFLGRDKAQISRLVSQGMDLLTNNEAFILMFDALTSTNEILNANY